MASLKQSSTGNATLLEPHHLVGRALTCNLRLDPMYVSAQHASLRWANSRWEVKDLGSSNGTFVNGERLRSGEMRSIHEGARVAFGSPDDTWELVDASVPSPMAVPLDGGGPVVMEGDLLALPSAEEPSVMIYSAKPGTGSGLGSWLLEDPQRAVVAIANMHVFECAGRAWRFSCAEDAGTFKIPDSGALSPRSIHLAFTVSRNEEVVHMQMHAGGRTVDLGMRAHNYLLVTLARQRLHDREAQLSEAICGWIDLEDRADPRMSGPQLNLDVYRIRKQFQGAGVIDAVGIIERRPTDRQLRIGVERLTVVRE